MRRSTPNNGWGKLHHLWTFTKPSSGLRLRNENPLVDHCQNASAASNLRVQAGESTDRAFEESQLPFLDWPQTAHQVKNEHSGDEEGPLV
jgi:hypothetical protein